jgi:cysteine desulfurase
MEPIYLDHHSTTPVLPEVVEAMRPYWAEAFGNPASAHAFGRRARQALETAREQVAELLGTGPGEVVFTSGATEANNLAIFGLADDAPGMVVSSSIEHPSVHEPVQELKRRGFDVALLPVDAAGVTRADSLPSCLTDRLRLVTVMLANNETGALQPVRELAERWRQADLSRSAFHCDAVQAVGKIPVHFRQLGVTSLSLSAHKFNGPRGIGALLLDANARLQPRLLGGHQQQGRRPGTEAVALAVGLAKGLELAYHEMEERTGRLKKLRQRFLEHLRRAAAPVILNGPDDGGLPGVLNLSFPGCEAAVLLMKLDLAGIACSTGSACSSGSLLPSPVLQAMGCSPARLASAMRFSLSHLNSEQEIAAAAERVASVVMRLRDVSEPDR